MHGKEVDFEPLKGGAVVSKTATGGFRNVRATFDDVKQYLEGILPIGSKNTEANIWWATNLKGKVIYRIS